MLVKSSTVFVEGNATINTYQDAEGKTRSGLNVTQRKLPTCDTRIEHHGISLTP